MWWASGPRMGADLESLILALSPLNVAWRWKGWDPSAFLSQGIQAAQPDGFSWGKACGESESPVW